LKYRSDKERFDVIEVIGAKNLMTSMAFLPTGVFLNFAPTDYLINKDLEAFYQNPIIR